MHFRRKGIVYFVIQQIAALFADGNELLNCLVFFFKAYYCHRFLPQSDDNPAHSYVTGRESTNESFIAEAEQADV